MTVSWRRGWLARRRRRAPVRAAPSSSSDRAGRKIEGVRWVAARRRGISGLAGGDAKHGIPSSAMCGSASPSIFLVRERKQGEPTSRGDGGRRSAWALSWPSPPTCSPRRRLFPPWRPRRRDSDEVSVRGEPAPRHPPLGARPLAG